MSIIIGQSHQEYTGKCTRARERAEKGALGDDPRGVIRHGRHFFLQREVREKRSGPKSHWRYPHFEKMAKERPIKLAAGGFHLGEAHNKHRAILPRPSSRDFVNKTGVPPRPARYVGMSPPQGEQRVSTALGRLRSQQGTTDVQSPGELSIPIAPRVGARGREGQTQTMSR